MANQITIASVQMYVHQEQKKNLIQIEKHLKHIKNIFQICRFIFKHVCYKSN